MKNLKLNMVIFSLFFINLDTLLSAMEQPVATYEINPIPQIINDSAFFWKDLVGCHHDELFLSINKKFTRKLRLAIDSFVSIIEYPELKHYRLYAANSAKKALERLGYLSRIRVIDCADYEEANVLLRQFEKYLFTKLNEPELVGLAKLVSQINFAC